jgi:PAS domain S-box-containing protein
MSLTTNRREPSDDGSLRAFGDVVGALDRLPLPMFAIRSDGVIQWLNAAAQRVVGDKIGTRFINLVAPESRSVARDAFASKIVGARELTYYDAALLRGDGTRVEVEVCSVPVDGDAGIVGVFGVAAVETDAELHQPDRVVRALTPRQAEVLRYLVRGYKTNDMAEAMGISTQTVRNHVRGLLQALGVHSRLEAVATARDRGLA